MTEEKIRVTNPLSGHYVSGLAGNFCYYDGYLTFTFKSIEAQSEGIERPFIPGTYSFDYNWVELA